MSLKSFGSLGIATLAFGLLFASELRAEKLADPSKELPTVSPNYHFVGWSNALLPGTGSIWLGKPYLGLFQASYEVGTIALGLSLTNSHTFTLDGAAAELPKFKVGRRSPPVSLDREFYGDILQEFGLKAHMVNTFTAYREAAQRASLKKEETGIDDSSLNSLFLAPFDAQTMTDPWVYIPLGVLTTSLVADYFIHKKDQSDRTSKITPYSNFLYAFNYGLWQPTGSGAPEEMFYRGFLQNEFLSWVPSPYFAIPMSSIAFSLSHGPGSGHLTSLASGLYLGLLSYKNHGSLAPGIALHFWAVIALGVETILLSHLDQHTTPPTSLAVQVGF